MADIYHLALEEVAGQLLRDMKKEKINHRQIMVGSPGCVSNQ